MHARPNGTGDERCPVALCRPADVFKVEHSEVSLVALQQLQQAAPAVDEVKEAAGDDGADEHWFHFNDKTVEPATVQVLLRAARAARHKEQRSVTLGRAGSAKPVRREEGVRLHAHVPQALAASRRRTREARRAAGAHPGERGAGQHLLERRVHAASSHRESCVTCCPARRPPRCGVCICRSLFGARALRARRHSSSRSALFWRAAPRGRTLRGRAPRSCGRARAREMSPSSWAPWTPASGLC